jgi:hypothetical protein
VRDYIHVMDLALGHSQALKKLFKTPDIGKGGFSALYLSIFPFFCLIWICCGDQDSGFLKTSFCQCNHDVIRMLWMVLWTLPNMLITVQNAGSNSESS